MCRFLVKQPNYYPTRGANEIVAEIQRAVARIQRCQKPSQKNVKFQRHEEEARVNIILYIRNV